AGSTPRGPPPAERGLPIASEPIRAAERTLGHARSDELTGEADRIGRLSSIREIVFGTQDGLVSTFAVVAGLAAAGVGHLVVLLGGLVSAVAGVLSMLIGTFLAARAQRQPHETELERERRELGGQSGGGGGGPVAARGA